MNLDEIIYSLKNLKKRKRRSGLTVLSILIGIMAVFALVSFGLGIQNYVDTLADQAGRDKLFIQAKSIGAPGTDSNFFITKEDIDFVGRIKGVKESSGMYFKAGETGFKKEKRYNFVIGLDVSKINFLEEAFTVKVIKGRQLKKGDVDKAVLGYNYQLDDKLFQKALSLGDKITINGEQFEIVGFYKEVGNPQDDSHVYITNAGMERLYPSIKDTFGYAIVQADRGVNPEELADKIEEKLRKHKGQEEGKENFYVQSLTDLLKTFSIVIDVINGVLVLIALISLVVASVNIMNTMYTAVLERTKEIGIMKSIGAKNSDIFIVFVFESGILGLAGGAIGVVMGYIVAKTGGSIAASAGYSLLKPIFPWYLTAGCLMFAFLIGSFSGLLPAYRASKLKPVDALRYE